MQRREQRVDCQRGLFAAHPGSLLSPDLLKSPVNLADLFFDRFFQRLVQENSDIDEEILSSMPPDGWN